MATTVTPQEQKAFLDNYADIITQLVAPTTLFASSSIAHCALESGWGKSNMGSANNYFGFKATSSWKGKVASRTTYEYINGVKTKFVGTGKDYSSYAAAIADGAHTQTIFRAYDGFRQSCEDYVRLLTTASRYASAVKVSTSPKDQIYAILKAGYATASADKYSESIVSVIRQHDLTKYDKKKV